MLGSSSSSTKEIERRKAHVDMWDAFDFSGVACYHATWDAVPATRFEQQPIIVASRRLQSATGVPSALVYWALFRSEREDRGICDPVKLKKKKKNSSWRAAQPGRQRRIVDIFALLSSWSSA